MSSNKEHNSPFSSAPSQRVQLQLAVLIDDVSQELFIHETILRASGIAKKITVVQDPSQFIHSLQNTERLSDVPEAIFINKEMKSISITDFLTDYNHLSDFIRNKCLLILITDQPIIKSIEPKGKIKYLPKPIDVFQLKEFIKN